MATDNTVKDNAQTVTVACKLPHGLVLQLATAQKVPEPVLGGGTREAVIYRHAGEQVTLFGTSHPQNAGPQCRIIGGYALTENVNAKFWAQWLEQNKEHAAVKNKMIFAWEKPADTVAQAQELAKTRSGMERLDPDKLPKGLKRDSKAEATA